MKIQLKILLISFLFITSGFGQDLTLLKRAVQELEVKIPSLKRAAVRYNAHQAEAYLDKALIELENVRRNMQQPPRLVEAWAAYKKSKAFVDLASRILLIKPALRINAEMDKLILQAENEVSKTNLAEARYMLTRARSFRLESVNAFRNERYIKAQEFNRIAVYFANKAIEVAQGNTTGPDIRQQYRKIRENLNSLYADINTSESGNATLMTLLKKVKLSLEQAQIAYEKGQSRQAVQYLQIAERLLYRSADLKQQTILGQRERIHSNLLSLDQYISGIENDLPEIPAQSNLRLIKKARQFMQGAWRDYEMNSYAQAESKIALAQRMATKAMKILPRTQINEEYSLERRLAEIRQLLSMQESQLSSNRGIHVSTMHQQIKLILNDVETDISAGRPRIAYQKLSLALRLVNRVESILSNPTSEGLSKTQLLERQKQIENLVLNLSEQNKKNLQIKTVGPIFNQLLERSAQAIEQDNLIVATELLNFVQRQIQNLLKDVAY